MEPERKAQIRQRLIDLFGEHLITEMFEEYLLEGNYMELAEAEQFKKPLGRSSERHWTFAAFEKLVAARLPFATTFSGQHEVLLEVLKATCPYCQTQMAPADGSGSNFETSHTNFKCPKCQSRLTLNTVAQRALSFQPPKEEPAPTGDTLSKKSPRKSKTGSAKSG